MRHYLSHRVASLLKKYAAEARPGENISTPVKGPVEEKPGTAGVEQGAQERERKKEGEEGARAGETGATAAAGQASAGGAAPTVSEVPRVRFMESQGHKAEGESGEEDRQLKPRGPAERVGGLDFDTRPVEEFILETGQAMSEIFPGLAYRIYQDVGNIPGYAISLMFPLHAEALKNILPEIGAYYEARDRLNTLPPNDRRVALRVLDSTYGRVKNQFHRIMDDISLRLREVNTFDYAVRSLGLLGARKYLGEQGLNFYPMFLAWRQAQYNLAIKDALDRGIPVDEQPIPFANRVNGINSGSFFDQAYANYSTVATLLRQNFSYYEDQNRLHDLLSTGRLSEFALALNWLVQNDPFFTTHLVFTTQEMSNFHKILEFAKATNPGLYNQLLMAATTSDRKHREFVDTLEDAINTVRAAAMLSDEEWKDPETRNRVINALNVIGAMDPTMLAHVDPENRGYVEQVLGKLGNDIERVHPSVRFGEEAIVEAISTSGYYPLAGILHEEQNMRAIMQNTAAQSKAIIERFEEVVNAFQPATPDDVEAQQIFDAANDALTSVIAAINEFNDMLKNETLDPGILAQSVHDILWFRDQFVKVISETQLPEEERNRLTSRLAEIDGLIQNTLSGTRYIRVETGEGKVMTLFDAIYGFLSKTGSEDEQFKQKVLDIVQKTPRAFKPPGVESYRFVETPTSEQYVQAPQPQQGVQAPEAQAVQKTEQPAAAAGAAGAQPAAQQPSAQQPAAQQPSAQQPAAQQPAAQPAGAQAAPGAQAAQQPNVPAVAAQAVGQQPLPITTPGTQPAGPQGVAGAVVRPQQPIIPPYTRIGSPGPVRNVYESMASFAQEAQKPQPEAFRGGKRINYAYRSVVLGPYYSPSGRYSELSLLRPPEPQRKRPRPDEES